MWESHVIWRWCVRLEKATVGGAGGTQFEVGWCYGPRSIFEKNWDGFCINYGDFVTTSWAWAGPISAQAVIWADRVNQDKLASLGLWILMAVNQIANFDSRLFNQLVFFHLLVFENVEHLGLPFGVRVRSEMFSGSNNIAWQLFLFLIVYLTFLILSRSDGWVVGWWEGGWINED